MQKISLKEINKLALPAILAGIAEPLISLADTAIIGNMNEHATEAIGAAGMASSFFLLLVWGLAQIRTAVSALVSKYLGMNKIDEIKSLIPQAFAISMILGLLFWAGTSFFAEDIFQHLYKTKADSPLTLQFATDYYSIRSIGLPIALLIACVFGVFRGWQNTAWAMRISLIGGGLNLLLDLLLVYGIDGIVPAMGVKGAALASLIAQIVMLALALLTMLKKTPFHFKLSFKPNPELGNMTMMAINMVIRTFALNFAFFLAYRFANDYGTSELAAYTIGVNIWLFSAFFIDGYSNAGNAMSGKLLGQADYKKLSLLGKDLIKINLIISSGLSLVYLASYPIMGTIYSNDVEVIELFESFFWIVIISQPINAIAFTFDGIFKGLGETKYLRNVLLMGTFVGFVPVIYLLDYANWGLYAIWSAFVVWMIIRAASLWIQFNRKYKTDV